MITKVPKIPRELNDACKLTDENISEIRQLYSQNVSLNNIAKKFNVGRKAIYYWTHEEYRQRVNHTERRTFRTREAIIKTQNRCRSKRKKLFKKDVLKYKAEALSKWRKANKNKMNFYARKWYKKNSDKVNKRRRERYKGEKQ